MDKVKLKKTIREIEYLLQDLKRQLDANTKEKKTKEFGRGRKADNLANNTKLDFSMPIRAFVKKYASGMSGPRKFTLLVAYLSRGDSGKNILLSSLEKEWGRMTSKSLLGMKFNSFYTARAKENDWVESKKKGEYNLRPEWQKIFS